MRAIAPIGTPYADTYVYFNEQLAIASGEEDFIGMYEDFFEYKESGGANKAQVLFDGRNSWFGRDMDVPVYDENNNFVGGSGDYFALTTGGLGESHTIIKKSGIVDGENYIADMFTFGDAGFYNDGISASALGTGERANNILRFSESNVDGGSVPIRVISTIRDNPEGQQDFLVSSLFTNNRDIIYWDTNVGAPEDVLAFDSNSRLKAYDLAVPSNVDLFSPRMELSTAELFGDQEFINEFGTYDHHRRSLETLQKNAKTEFELLVKETFGKTQGEQVLNDLRANADDPEGYIATLETQKWYQDGLRSQGFTSFPSLDQQTTARLYPGDIVADRGEISGVLESWKTKEFPSENLPLYYSPRENPTEPPRFGFRMYTADYNLGAGEVYGFYF